MKSNLFWFQSAWELENPDCTTQSVGTGIPKQSLGTRNAERRGRHSQTEFGNEKKIRSFFNPLIIQ